VIGAVLGHSCDEEATDEIAGRKAGTHGTERFQIGHESRAKFRGQGPERLALDDVHADVPAFRAILREILAMHHLQAARNEEVAGNSGTDGTFSDICLTRLVWLITIGDFRVRETSRLSPLPLLATKRPQTKLPGTQGQTARFLIFV